MTHVDPGSAGIAGGRTGAGRFRATVITSALVGSRFLPIWLATGVLFIVCELIAPETLSSLSFSSAILPLMAFVAVAAIGQTLVIMTGGIDLSTPGVIVLVAHLVVGFSGGQNDKLAPAILEPSASPPSSACQRHPGRRPTASTR